MGGMHLRRHLLGIALLAIDVSNPAFAALGDNESSIRGDQQRLHAVSWMIEVHSKYSVHQLELPSKAIVRQFVSTTGQVFGVAWQGPVLPNLRHILGTYFEQYSAGARVSIRRPGLVVRSGGKMRAFFGKAYVLQMLPEGVAIEDIQ